MGKIDLDILDIYLKEIGDIPMLSEEEEKLHTKNLKLFDDISFLSRVSIREDYEEIFDLDLVLSSLTNNNYEEVLNSLISYFKYKDQYKSLYDKLIRYRNIAKELNRPLNVEELKQNFNIEKNEKIDSKELLEQVKKYIIYQTSFDKLYESNLRFVVSIVKKHNNISEASLDLINEGNLGLRRAIQKFNPDSNTKLTSYASYWINCRAMRYYYSHKNMLVSSTRNSNDFQSINKKITEIENTEGTLTIEELAKRLNISTYLVNYALFYSYTPSSLSQELTEDGDMQISDIVTDGISAEDEVLSKMEIELIDRLVDNLDDKKREIIKYRFGINTNEDRMTLKEIGKKLNISKQATQLHEQSALRILRNEYEKRNKVK